jgi:hypothetical protein
MAENEQQHNQRVHQVALSATKLGDGLVDPKLVLSWLLTTVGVGAGWIGWLVPVREAGALLPQLFTAQWLRNVAVRKWWWVWGSVAQGVAVLFVAACVLTLEVKYIGPAVILCLSVFAVARSICSVSYKDVLGKTVEKPRRGLVTGTAASLAAGGVLVFGLLLMTGVVERLWLVLGALGLAGLLWLFAGSYFTRLAETPSTLATETNDRVWQTYLGYVTTDRELQKFLLVRGLLTATAIAPPFLLLVADAGASSPLQQIGVLVVTASFATFISGRAWGRLADRSTAAVLAGAGFACSLFLLLGVVGALWGWYDLGWFLPLVIFGVMVSYQGVRIARSIHLVNLADEATRAAYTAISNTIIGVVLLGTGIFGWVAVVTSPLLVVGLLAMLSFGGGGAALTLQRV